MREVRMEGDVLEVDHSRSVFVVKASLRLVEHGEASSERLEIVNGVKSID
ncbi:hypothetical protein A2U01_0052199 [Trifolium medium]|uniref:Uncharacterized protein n=1 Tax=Trifolium medium TaxID=97028 RepID=A0A392R318_9FABA|nr:hypothetical protein [Trifolium medium]